MNVKPEAGDVYFLDAERILVYGLAGIVLKLGQRNLERLRTIYRTHECVKDTDMSDRRFTVAYDENWQKFRFEVVGGETVRVEAWQLVPDVLEKMAA